MLLCLEEAAVVEELEIASGSIIKNSFCQKAELALLWLFFLVVVDFNIVLIDVLIQAVSREIHFEGF